MALTFEGLDDDHVPAAARTCRTSVVQLGRRIDRGRRCHPEQLTDVAEHDLAGGSSEQTVVADAVKALGQDVEQEAADELVGGKGHDLLPVGATPTVVLVAEGDAGLVEAQQPAVRDGDAVGVPRQVGEHRLRPGERRLGVDNPALLPDRRQLPQEGAPVTEVGEAAVEREPLGIMQRHQPGEEQAAEQLAQYPDR